MEPILVQSLREKSMTLTDFARRMSVNKSTVTRWAQKRIPAERVLDVERATGVGRHLLRPDLYPPIEAAPSTEPRSAA